MSKMTKDEDDVYMKAFGASKAKTVKERMAEADAAVANYRKGGAMRAVEKGIKEGTLQERAKSRRERMDEVAGFGINKK